MPSTYAHYRMGQEVRKEVNNTESNIIEQYPELFFIGLHGPDILFYYNPLYDNKVNSQGYQMHDKAGSEFFTKAARVIKEHENQNQNAYLAYIYGFICHFALDVTCHAYIDEKIKKSGISHAEIEVEFDRELMVQDGYNPVTHHLTNHIKATAENAEIIKEFFEGISAKQIQKALEGMIANDKLLVAPSKAKRKMISFFLKATGNYKEMHGLLVNFKKNPACEDSTNQLLLFYEKAKKLSWKLIWEFRIFVNGYGKLNPIYEYTFGGKLPVEEIGKNNKAEGNAS